MTEFKLPKLSEFLKPLAEFEANVRSQIETSTGLPLPLGPAEMTKNVLESIEITAEGIIGDVTKGKIPLPEIQPPVPKVEEFEETEETPKESGEVGAEEGSKKKELSFEV